jgi:hypothetical protein
MALFDEQIFDDRIFDTKPPVSDHTYYHIQGLEGDGTPDNAFRPVGLAGVDWAASYDPDDSTSAFVCVKARPTTLATLPLQSGVTVLADITTLRNQGTVETTDPHILSMLARWSDTMVS